MCRAGNKVKPKLFLKVYNEDAGECQIWERGKTFYNTLSGLSSRYKPLYNEVIEIERNGKSGDMQTTYQVYPVENSPIKLDDYLENCPEPSGLSYLDKTAEEMNDFINTGNFGESLSVARARTEEYSERPVRRRDNSNRAF